ncbi:MAG TPA: hypothetical protein VGY57_02410 [Vicinamibacterales bacterium]|jgi:hypothetical protein|nr:hypothetical protein [Vicinamibacterales bacterium]
MNDRFMTRRGLPTLACLTLLPLMVLAAAPGDAPDPVLDAVLKRAGQYVLDFERQLSGVVAEETYVQTSLNASGAPIMPGGRRQMKSDLLMVKPIGSSRYLAFRDVFEVDRREVRDRQDRLMKLFLEPSASTAAQVQAIMSESARFNIGRVYRNINLPPFALLFLDPGTQPGFKFKTTNGRRVELPMSASPPAAAMVVAYEETARPTVIQNREHGDLFSHGRLWIEPLSGRVLMTELLADNADISAFVEVMYREEPGIAPPVPVEMRERYIRRRDGSRTEGVATYSHFRQFQVKVDEKIAPIKE